jgi:hypothetical protein
MELYINGLSNDAIRVSDYCGEDGGIVKLHVMGKVDAVLSYGDLYGLGGQTVPWIPG